MLLQLTYLIQVGIALRKSVVPCLLLLLILYLNHVKSFLIGHHVLKEPVVCLLHLVALNVLAIFLHLYESCLLL